jgi:ubiquinone/menaquinone biosynthesis C-methylase UbiE
VRAREVWERWFVERGELGPASARELVLSLGEIRDRIIEGARLAPPARVVDVGCGRGLLAFGAADLVGRDGEVVGVDVSTEALGAAAPLARQTGVALVCGDARRLPLPDGRAGAVIWRSLLVYLERREEALAEALRVLAPGGRLSFSESLGREMDVPLDDPAMTTLWGALKEFMAAALGDAAFTPESLEAMVETAGFAHARCERERRRTRLPDARAARAFFEEGPPGGLSLAGLWRACGIEEQVLEPFLEGVAAAAPLLIETPEGYVTARKPDG